MARPITLPRPEDVAPMDVADTQHFRAVLGRFCTGVTVITGVIDGAPHGFACQSFLSLSLDPPLVAFSASRTSRSYAAIRNAGAFCVNVLSEEQRELCRVFGQSSTDKWDGVSWSPAKASGSPVLAGAIAWVDCTIEAEHAAGDHHIVIGRVNALAHGADARPLLFFRGDYAAFATA